MLPHEVVERWVERFNAGDAAGLADLYHDDAVNHQVTQEPIEGRNAIRAMFEREGGGGGRGVAPRATMRGGP
jgi:uncharacterized protein (TIGR02246 family)